MSEATLLMQQHQLDQIHGLLDPMHKTLREKFEEEKYLKSQIPFDDS